MKSVSHKINEKKLLRVLDANFNRAKEALRVCEDICRFLFDDQKKTAEFKTLRHRLTSIMETLPLDNLIKSRDIEKDVGKKTFETELQRKNIFDIFYANSQRAKESLRVLEEFTKLLHRRRAPALKKIRYEIYGLEKKVSTKF